jgi:hypothetical protein
MTAKMRTMFRVTSDLASSAFKKLLLTVVFVAVLASIFTVSVLALAYKIAK